MADFLLDLPKYNDASPVGPRRLSWPFEENGDVDTIVFVQNYLQRSSKFKKLTPGTEHDTYKGYYLIAQSDPVETHVGNLYRFTRTYSRIPGTQIVYSTVSLTKPLAVSGGAVGDVSYAVYADTSVVGSATYFPYYLLTLGTFSVWMFERTRIYGPLQASTSANNGGNTRVTRALHGITNANDIVARYGFSGNDYCLFASGTFNVVDVNTIDLLGVNWAARTTFIAKYYRAYTPGLGRLGCKITSDFYLPGVTGGITTPADIPLPDALINDNVFLPDVINYLTGYLDYDARALTKWRNGPIYQLDKIQIDIATVK